MGHVEEKARQFSCRMPANALLGSIEIALLLIRAT